MGIELGMITIDCADPRGLAAFWTKALEVEVDQDHGGEFLILRAKKENGPVFAFQRVPEERAGKNRVHVDFGTDDMEKEVGRLIGLGAKKLDEHKMPGFAWTVLADPVGNEFCVATHEG
ncbi:VOC family protein [Amycolatopsis keratiniphila]|uniref:Glyoxalase/bleomycin resistance protein/dioxygenase n=1 Tax=Amycolatopsis keratiniphila TaxID=129921 RepID=R4SYM9_9PSEU|nr:VOC family protein [Amycolatopsis keratiniphila]AGM08419.1 glyoxalase/bleomycin resistance protein/dioxygenase [Amycolatopsis keratiniphila]